MFAKVFCHLSLLLVVLNIMKLCGWVTIPWLALMVPSSILAIAWMYLILVATCLAIDEIKRMRK